MIQNNIKPYPFNKYIKIFSNYYMNNLIDIYNNILKYDNNILYVYKYYIKNFNYLDLDIKNPLYNLIYSIINNILNLNIISLLYI